MMLLVFLWLVFVQFYFYVELRTDLTKHFFDYGGNKTFQDCGVRKLTVVDSGRVVVSNLARQSLYTSDDRDSPKASAILGRLRERCPSVVNFNSVPSKQSSFSHILAPFHV